MFYVFISLYVFAILKGMKHLTNYDKEVFLILCTLFSNSIPKKCESYFT